MAGVGAAGKAFQGELAVTLSTNQSGARHLQKAFRMKSLPVSAMLSAVSPASFSWMNF